MHEYRDFEPGSPLKSYLRVARDALFDTQRFFAAVAGSGGLLWPAHFVIASYAWGSALFALPATLRLAGEIYAGLFGSSTGVTGEPAFWLLAVVCLPVVLAVFAVCLALFTFVVALFWHPLVVLAVGKGSGFGATFRVLAYTSVIYALGSLVPFVGPLVAVFFGVVFSGIAVRAAHQTSTPRAMLAVALPWIFYLVLNLALVLYGSFVGDPPGFGR